MIVVAVGGALTLVSLVGMIVGITLGAVNGWESLIVALVGITLVASLMGGGLTVAGVFNLVAEQKAAAAWADGDEDEDDDEDSDTTVLDLGEAETFGSGERIKVTAIHRTGEQVDGRYPVTATVIVNNPTVKSIDFSEQEFRLYDDWGPARFDERTYANIPDKLAPGKQYELKLYFNAVAEGGYALDYGDTEWQ